MVTKTSPFTVQETVERIEAALELPLKVLVWQDGEQTRLASTGPQELGERYGLPPELSGRLAAINAVTEAAIQA